MSNINKKKNEKNVLSRRKFLSYSSAAIIGSTFAKPVFAKNNDPHYKPETGMKYRRLGRTNLMISEIGVGLGVMQQIIGEFLFKKYRMDIDAVANKLLDLGGNFVTTTPYYHDTVELVGNALKNRRDEVYYAIGLHPGAEEKMRNTLETSLKQLHTDCIDLLFSYGRGTDEGFKILRNFQEEGKIRFIGLSQHDHRHHEWAIRQGYVDFIQAPYNRLSWLKQEGSLLLDHTERMFKLAKEKDVGIICIKPLTGNFIPYWANQTHDPEIKDIMKKLKKYGSKNLYQAMLRWNLANPGITGCAVGMDTVQMVVDNAEAITTRDKNLSAVQDELLEDYVHIADKDYCRLCETFIPHCPKGIPVPDILRFRMYYNNYKSEKYAMDMYNELPDNRKVPHCDKCGNCEEYCPYGLKIVEKLQSAHAILANGKSHLA